MTTFSIVEDASVGASGVSSGVITSVKNNILAAAELWNRYFSQGAFDIKIELAFANLPGSTLATGGSGLSFVGGEGPGLEVWKVDSMEEYITGSEVGGTGVDITITVDTPLLQGGEFFFDPDPFARTAPVPFGKSDFMSVMLHELGHGFGYLSINSAGMDAVDDTDTSDSGFIDLTPFDVWVDPDAPGGRSFVGPSATAIFGGDILLDPDSMSHLASAADGGFENLMDPSLLVGSRSYIAPIHVAIFEDIGLPVRKPTAGGDELFGFEFSNDVVSLLAGNDSYNGLSGNDLIRGGDGADTLVGDAGDDTLRGDGGNDQLFSGFGDDRAEGGAGIDLIRTGPGSDTLLGGTGDDTLGASNRSDLLRGGSGNDLMLGSNGNDRLFGDGGNDTLLGGNGRDTLNGGLGADRLVGNGNNDTASYASATSAVQVRLWNSDGTQGEATGDQLIDMENLIGSTFNDTLAGDDGVNRVDGGAGNDILQTLGGADNLTGGAGDDTMTGGAGNDTFQFFAAAPGADVITDFVAGAASGDVIRLLGFGSAFDTFGEVIGAATQAVDDVIINFGSGDTITLTGVALGDLNAGDFLFS